MRLPFHLFNLASACLPSRCHRARKALARACGCHVGEGVKINAHVRLYGASVTIGGRTWVGPECLFFTVTDGPVTIGQNCDIAPGVAFVSGSHEVGGSGRRAGKGYALPIVVGDGCWIAARALILGGARIGDGCVVAAGAVVLPGEYPDNSLLAGAPAKVVKSYEA